jgi:hypothetical protein
LEAICQNLDQALVQWQNMAIHKHKNVKIAKSQKSMKYAYTPQK